MPILRHIYDSATGAYVDVEVTQEVYDFYRRNAWAIRRNSTRFYAHEIQFSSLVGGENGALECFDEFFSDRFNPLRILCKNAEARCLAEAFRRLSQSDQHILYFLVVEGHSERWYGKKVGLPQKTVHNRKCRALTTLQNMLGG